MNLGKKQETPDGQTAKSIWVGKKLLIFNGITYKFNIVIRYKNTKVCNNQ
jgi:hypothetical protein